MSEVKVTLNPSEQLIKQAVAEALIIDERGRQIMLKKAGVLAQFRLVKILGESAKNEVYMGMVLPLIFVASIDGDAVAFPQSEREIEALIQRLDEDGITAVMEGVQANFGKPDPEKDKAELKN